MQLSSFLKAATPVHTESVNAFVDARQISSLVSTAAAGYAMLLIKLPEQKKVRVFEVTVHK